MQELTLTRVVTDDDAMSAIFTDFGNEMSSMSGMPSRTGGDVGEFISRSDYHSYYIMLGSIRCGLAVVREEPDGVHYLRYFYIVPDFRKAGIGRQAASEVFSTAAGHWRVNTMDWNQKAVSFWHTVCSHYSELSVVRRSDGLGPQWEFSA